MPPTNVPNIQAAVEDVCIYIIYIYIIIIVIFMLFRVFYHHFTRTPILSQILNYILVILLMRK